MKNYIYRYFLSKNRVDAVPSKIVEDEANILSFKRTGKEKLVNSNFSVVSFDVFDTVLLHSAEPFLYRERIIAEKSVVILHEYGFFTSWPELFTLRRASFEKSQRETGDEVDYFKAYKDVFNNLNLNPILTEEVTKKILDAEVCYMCNVTFVNPDIIKCIKLLKSKGKKIIAISDMYLPQQAVKQMFIHHGLVGLFDEIFTSSQTLTTKHSGRLYASLIEQGKLTASTTIHIGDNFHSDALMARQNGLAALHYYNFENETRKIKVKYKSFQQAIFTKNAASSKNFVGILAVSFVQYIDYLINECIKNKTKKIFFLTRDANFLQPYFELYLKKHYSGVCIESSTLATSRLLSFSLNYNTEADFFDRIWSLNVNPQVDSVEKVLNMFEIEVTKTMSEIYRWAHMSYSNARQDPDFIVFMGQLLQKIQKSSHDYLFKQNLFEFERVALVDVGYSGTSFREISDYIEREELNFERVDCYLYATNKHIHNNIPWIKPPVFLHGYSMISALSSPIGVSFNYSWLEPLTLDKDKGRLVGYRFESKTNTYIPIFAAAPALSVEFEELIAKFKSELDLHVQQKHSFAENDNTQALFECVSYPDTEMLDTLRKVEHSHGYSNSNSMKILQSFPLSRLESFLGTAEREDLWVAGSLKASGFSKITPFMYKYLEIKRHVGF